MNKSKIFTVALACILGLSACVDDKESASVENVRNAKAAQLNSLAAYQTAMGEAAKMNAEATKLLAEAKAASKNQTTEESKQKFEIAIEKLKAEAARLTAEAKKAEQAAIEEMQKNTQDHLTATLFANYKIANGTLTTLNDALFREQVKLIGLQAGVTDWKVQKAEDIIGYKQIIAVQEGIKTALKALPANDYDAVKVAAAANKESLKGINDRLAVATSVQSKAQNAYLVTINAIADGKTGVNASVLAQSFYNDQLVKVDYVSPKDANGVSASREYPTFTINDQRIKAKGIELKEYSLTFDVALGKTDGTEVGTLYAALKDAKATEATAKTAAEAVGATEADRAAYVAAIRATQDVLDGIAQNRTDKDQSLADYDMVMAAQAAITADATTYAAAVVAAEAAGQAGIVATLALAPINVEVNTNTTLQAVLDVLAGTPGTPGTPAALTNIAAEIATCDRLISAAQKKIVIAEGIAEADQFLAESNAKIEAYKLEIAAQELIVKSLKAQLDAELAA